MLYFNCNGKIYAAHTAVIAPDNRGFRYGDGLFETIKVLKGQLIFSNEHFARLWKGMQLMQFVIPKHFTPELLEEEILSLIKKNGHEKGARIRLTVYRGDGGLYDAVNHTPNYMIQSWSLPEAIGELNSNGLVLGLYEAATKSCDSFSNLKHNNYLPYVMAALKAKEEKWNDAVILNQYKRICDTTIANIFIIKGDNIFTPSLSEGCVAGVMREYIISKLKQSSFVVKEGPLDIAAINEADEIFLTNSINNIRWVKQFGDSEYTNRLTQKIYSNFIKTI